MAKQIEDIIPSEKKSIRDIPIPESRRKNINLIDDAFKSPSSDTPPSSQMPRSNNFTERDSRPSYQVPSQPVSDIRPNEPRTPTPLPRVAVPPHRDFSPSPLKRHLPKKPAIIVGALGLIILALGVFSLFDKTTITYVPRTAAVSFNSETFTAKKEGLPEDLLFSVIKISQERSEEAPASGEVEVSERASGIIIVYNNSSASPQRLIKNTRFETPDGKVYRIQSDITVPGQRTVGGKKEPGALEVTVYADKPGETYNIGLSDFTLPGLKGDPKFTTIYARSKTAMAGGFVGIIKKVSAEDKASAETVIETELKKSLYKEASAQVPEDFILLPNLTQITYEKLADGESTNENAIVRERGNFSGIIFKKTDLVKFISSQKTAIASTDVVDADLASLNIEFVQIPNTDLALQESITFSISGDTIIVWISDEAAIARDLLGKGKGELETVLNNYPSIVEADAVVRPFWKRSFPDETLNIKFIKNIK